MKWIVLAASAIFAAAAVDAGQEQLSAAKELYASAAYEDALSVLTRLSEGDGAPALSRQADEYRAFCLYALGRTGEAEKLAESLIRRDPLIQLDRTAHRRASRRCSPPSGNVCCRASFVRNTGPRERRSIRNARSRPIRI